MFEDDILFDDDDTDRSEREPGDEEITEELFLDHSAEDAWEWACDDDPTFGF